MYYRVLYNRKNCSRSEDKSEIEFESNMNIVNDSNLNTAFEELMNEVNKYEEAGS